MDKLINDVEYSELHRMMVYLFGMDMYIQHKKVINLIKRFGKWNVINTLIMLNNKKNLKEFIYVHEGRFNKPYTLIKCACTQMQKDKRLDLEKIELHSDNNYLLVANKQEKRVYSNVKRISRKQENKNHSCKAILSTGKRCTKRRIAGEFYCIEHTPKWNGEKYG